MSTTVKVKFLYPVEGLDRFDTDDEKAALELAKIKYKNQKELSVEIFKEPVQEAGAKVVDGAGDVRHAERSDDTSPGDQSSGGPTSGEEDAGSAS